MNHYTASVTKRYFDFQNYPNVFLWILLYGNSYLQNISDTASRLDGNGWKWIRYDTLENNWKPPLKPKMHDTISSGKDWGQRTTHVHEFIGPDGSGRTKLSKPGRRTPSWKRSGNHFYLRTRVIYFDNYQTQWSIFSKQLFFLCRFPAFVFSPKNDYLS